MAWIRLNDAVPEHPKHLKAGPAACWLWVCGIAYCQRQLTDGFIPDLALFQLMPECVANESQASDEAVTDESQPSYPRVRTLAQRLVRAGLFERVPGGYHVHDYHDFNDTRAEAIERKAHLAQVRADAGRRGRLSRQANTKQTEKQVAEAKRSPIPSHPIPIVVSSKLHKEHSLEISEETLDLRAGHLVERYAELFYLHRHGARYHSRLHLDFMKAQELVRTWSDDARLEKLAVIVLETDDDWISRTDRGFAIFAAKATWADDRLKAWELEHGVTA